jgi:ribonuclease HI
MPTLERLQQAAYKAERSACRRLMRDSGIDEREALIRVLGESGVPLEVLLTARELAASRDAIKKSARKQQQAEALAQKRAREQPECADPANWMGWFDGSARPNPGQIGIGGVLRGPTGVRFEFSAGAGHGDSNEAEYLALIGLLELALRQQAAPLVICGDSRVVIDSLTSISHAGPLSDYHRRAMRLLMQLPKVSVHWIPRHRNTEADALSQRGCA